MILAAKANGLHRVPAAAMAATFAVPPEEKRFSEPLMLAAASGAIDCISINDPSVPWPTGHLRTATRPTVVLLGDDPGNPEGQGGPTAWRCTGRAAAWCHGAIINATGGKPEHYLEAVVGVSTLRRVLFVETTLLNAMDWHQVIDCPTTLLLMAQDVHPVDIRVLH